MVVRRRGPEIELSDLVGLAERSPADAIRVAAAVVMGELQRMVKDRNVPLLAEAATPHVLLSPPITAA